MKTNQFENYLGHLSPSEIKDAIVETCDTAEIALCWFKSQGVAASAADVVALTRLIVERIDIHRKLQELFAEWEGRDQESEP